jgi:catechol 2,3-dioxygenase-like lactoylglutathione lyase family enzyme
MKQLTDLIINRLQHIGIPITDKEVSSEFYARLGFDKVMEAPFDHESGSGICMMMQRGEIILELYQFPSTALDDIRARRDGHVDHIAFDVPDIDKTFLLMKEQKFHVIEDAPVLRAPSRTIV